DILSDVNQWLHFSEAKNAVLVTFDLALVVGIGTIATTGIGLPESFTVLSTVVCLGLMASAIIALSSFFPSFLKFLDSEVGDSYEGNVFYFGDLSSASSCDFLTEIYRKASGHERTAFDVDLANQIVTNSRIAIRKLRVFTFALRISVAFLLFAFFAIILEVCR